MNIVEFYKEINCEIKVGDRIEVLEPTSTLCNYKKGKILVISKECDIKICSDYKYNEKQFLISTSARTDDGCLCNYRYKKL